MNQRIAAIVIAVLLALGVIVVLWNNNRTQPSPTPTPTPTTTPPAPVVQPTVPPVTVPKAPTGVQFSTTGTIVINNPGLKAGVWYVVYEQPGKAAITRELAFTATSNCVTSGKTTKCSVTPLTPGSRVQVSGVLSDSIVYVATLMVVAVPQPPAQKLSVKLFYYNYDKDRDLGGGQNPACSADAVLPVNREIPVTNTPIQDTIRLLLKGELTQAEKNQGFQTEFPNARFTLVGANLVNGKLTLEFDDPSNFSTGGSCRVGILWAQIRKTALQFESVKQVEFKPEELFQP